MAKLLKLRRGTTTQHSSFTGAEGEVTVDTDKETLVVHDGSTAGGHPVAAEDLANVSSSTIAGRLSNDAIAVSKIAAGTLPSDVKIQDANVSGNLTIESADIVDGTIVNADVNASAAIAGTKISPDFGSQNTTTTGTTTTSKVTLNSTSPMVEFEESDGNPDYRIISEGGALFFQDADAGPATRIKINSDGHVDVLGNLDVGSGIDVTGIITSTGNVNTTGNVTITNEQPKVSFIDSGNNPDYQLANIDGVLTVYDSTNSADRLRVNADGHVDVVGHLDVGNGIDVLDGNITLASGHTVDGRDVSSDGSKLDGIESGATADQSNSEIKTAYEANSNTNAFTDALLSKLNGIAASATNVTNNNQLTNGAGYVTANTQLSNEQVQDIVGAMVSSNTESGITVTYQDGAGKIDFAVASQTDQNFTNADHSKLDGIEAGATADQTGAEIASALNGQHIHTTAQIGYDSNDHFQFTNNNRLDLYIAGNNEFRFESDGDFHADGDVYAYSSTTASDENLKKDVVTVADAVTKVEALKGVTFKWKKNDVESAGVIAQDVEKVLPQVVKVVADTDGTEFKAVNYGGLTSLLIEAVKDLSARIKVLEAK
jgi:hypothetical protein